ncbi:unnamed protein product [Closterium sp. Naga37s-1]|nr:unnamed protein product [Closterium sp. Naga37s-1]
MLSIPPTPPHSPFCRCSFGVLMLVVLTGRSPHTSDGEKNGHILQWVVLPQHAAALLHFTFSTCERLLRRLKNAARCIAADNNPAGLSMDAPDHAVLRPAQFPTPPTCPCSQPHPPAPVDECIFSENQAVLKAESMDAPDDALLRLVEECISANNSGGLKEMDMDAPDDAVLRLAHLALSCTAERTASRPNMSYVASELQARGGGEGGAECSGQGG